MGLDLPINIFELANKSNTYHNLQIYNNYKLIQLINYKFFYNKMNCTKSNIILNTFYKCQMTIRFSTSEASLLMDLVQLT